MTTHSLIKVGTSQAIIIPAKTIKKRGFTSSTQFRLEDTGDELILRPVKEKAVRLDFTKVKRPLVIDEDLKALGGSVSFSREELAADPLLQAIVEP